MDKLHILEDIRRNKQILSLPQVLSRILEEVSKEDFSGDKLAKIILQDPSLTSKILKLANSSLYQRMTQIKTVNQAVAMLGVTTVKCLALSSSVFHPDKITRETGIDPKEFFAYILSISAAAEKIAKSCGVKAPEEAMIAGLLNDIGAVYFLHHHGKLYRRVLELTNKGRSQTEAEVEVFGVDHCEIGRQIAIAWKLPDYVVDSIGGHHSTVNNTEKARVSNCVRLAVLLTTETFTGYQQPLDERLAMIGRASDTLSLKKEDVDQISFSLLSGSIEMAEYLGVEIGDYESMLVKANQ